MNSEVKKYYKYRPLRQGVAPHPFTASIFEKRELWYAAPKDFNDPYDCNLKLHARDSTDKEWMQYIDARIIEYPPDSKSLKKIKKDKTWKTKPELGEFFGNNTLALNREKSSMLCLSKKPNSIPMFSHYADRHRGIAIEFSFSDQNVPCGGKYSAIVCGDVEYVDSFPELNYHRLYGKSILVKNLLFKKHIDWTHETEYTAIPQEGIIEM